MKILSTGLSQRRKTAHISFRVESELKAELEKEAKQRNMNLNSLINYILSRHVSFDRIVETLEAIPLSRPLFTALLENTDIAEMERIGREFGPKVVRRTFTFLNLNYDLDGLIEHYFQPLSTYSRWYSFNTTGQGANRKLMFQHSYGPKWTAFLRQYLGGIIKSATGIEPRIVVEEELVTIHL